MGGRRFRLGRHRKNEELKRRREKEEKKLESEDTTPIVSSDAKDRGEGCTITRMRRNS